MSKQVKEPKLLESIFHCCFNSVSMCTPRQFALMFLHCSPENHMPITQCGLDCDALYLGFSVGEVCIFPGGQFSFCLL